MVDKNMNGPSPYRYLNHKEHVAIDKQVKDQNINRTNRYKNYMSSNLMKSTLSWNPGR